LRANIFINGITLPDFDAVKTVPGIRIPATQAVLQADLVHGHFSRYINYNYHYGHSSIMREK